MEGGRGDEERTMSKVKVGPVFELTPAQAREVRQGLMIGSIEYDKDDHTLDTLIEDLGGWLARPDVRVMLPPDRCPVCNDDGPEEFVVVDDTGDAVALCGDPWHDSQERRN